MARRKVEPITVDKNGRLTINACCDEGKDDRIRSVRLAEAARNGDMAAPAELDRMSDTTMYVEIGDNE